MTNDPADHPRAELLAGAANEAYGEIARLREQLREAGLRIVAAEAEADRWRARCADLAARLAWQNGESLFSYGNRARHVHGELISDLGKANPMYPGKLPQHRREMTEHYYYVILNHLKDQSSGLSYGPLYYIPIIDAILAELEIYGEHNYPQTRERWRWLRALAERSDTAMSVGHAAGERAAMPLDKDMRREEDRLAGAEALSWLLYQEALEPVPPTSPEALAARHWFSVGYRQGWNDAEYPEDDSDEL